MNYYAAREIKDKEGNPTGRWHYTRKNDDVVQPVGYCSAWAQSGTAMAGLAVCPRCEGKAAMDMGLACAVCSGSPHRGLVHVDTPCPGHPTPEGAYEHITKYVLDKATWTALHGFDKHHPRFCKTCDEPATTTAMLPSPMGQSFFFCTLHKTREDLAKAVGTIGNITASW